MLLPLVGPHPDLHFYVDTCVADLCLVFQGGGGQSEANSLLSKLVALVQIHVENKLKLNSK